MKTQLTEPEIELREQLNLNAQLLETIANQNQQIKHLQDQLSLLVSQIYGKKSEKAVFDAIQAKQISYLDDPEPPQPPVEKIQVPAHTKKKPGRKPLPESLPRVEVIHDIPEDEKQCECGESLSRIGEEISEQLNYIPAKLEVIRHIRPKYACRSCEGTESNQETVKVAPAPKQILPKSIASPGLLAHIITARYVDSLPFYRQEQQFKRLGFEISRSNMTNWCLSLAEKLEPLIQALKQEIRSGPLIHMDETTFQVLKEKDRSPSSKSYMWVMRTGASEHPGVCFHYSPTRSSKEAHRILHGYRGVVLTDGYSGYSFIKADPHMKHAGCWAHCRRNFTDIVKALKTTDISHGPAEEALAWIRSLYRIEKEIKDHVPLLTPEQIKEIRKDKSAPLLFEFNQWLMCRASETNPKGLLGKAISYAINHWESLTLYLDHGEVPIDNNPAENAIRPFVLGRKNSLFSDTVSGAKATAIFYSLVETAKVNELNPTWYMQTLFERLPYAESEADIRSLLPQYLKSTTIELN